jgi:NitT/TauT family transport system ATP-binding protein
MFQKAYLLNGFQYDACIIRVKIKGLDSKENIDRAMVVENFLLSKFKDHKPTELSEECGKGLLVLELLRISDVLLLDEPFSALDYQTRLKVCVM